MSKQASDYKNMVILSALLAPVWGGAIIYYSLNKSHNAMAKLGNNISFIAIAIWVAAFIAVADMPRIIPLSVGTVGTVLAVMTVVNIKKTKSLTME